MGEMKRRSFDPDAWQAGNLLNHATQMSMHYADKYECPQVFCFDGKTLLLQIHANTPGEIRAENSVDLGPSSSQQHAPSSQDVSSRSHQGGQCSRKQGSDVGNFFKKVEKDLVDKAISPSR
ncbi:hypothetical protein OCS_04696 [Ophiocordyceps sinensis CO18]|uniref:Uncharacterized protein n=1 Tax=Ophiocordyceps sinensis (strain Co18 / CGMCC 3.14243) TaxID=911162 RepID=T5ACM4_OPHSC|nr:hypothetical protein OCS_04696 [Ophiocordyceps sinensis CO18]